MDVGINDVKDDLLVSASIKVKCLVKGRKFSKTYENYGLWGEKLEGIGIPADWNFLFQGKEYIDFEGYNVYDFHSRSYDPWIGRFNQIDGANQFASGYAGMGNIPTIGIDPDGQWVHIVVGAVIGGAVNLGIKAFQGKIHSFKDGAAAFGIGAVAGGLTAATGGAASIYASTGSFAGAFSSTAVGAATTGLAGGAVAGGTGTMVGGAIQGIGNAAYFGDSYSVKEWAVGVGLGTITGGVGGGIAAKIQGKNILNGSNINDGAKGLFPNFGKAKWVKTNAGWKLSKTNITGWSRQFPEWTDAAGNVVPGGSYNYSAEVASNTRNNATPLLNSGALHKHHVLPQQFRSWFAQRGINNIDDYTVEISRQGHSKGVHGKGFGNLPGNWNKHWTDFIKANPSATPSQIFNHAEGMLKRYGLEHLRYTKYR